MLSSILPFRTVAALAVMLTSVCAAVVSAADESAEAIGIVTEDELPAGTAREAMRYATRSFDEWRVTLASDLDGQTRLVAVDAMVAFGKRGYQKEAVAALAAVLDSKDKKLAPKAALALGQFGEAAVAPLAAHLQKVDAGSRSVSARALRDIGPAAKPATAVLLEAIQNGDQACRRYAAEALGEIGADDEAVVAALVAALGDEDFQARREALGALVRLRAATEPARAAIRKESLGKLGYINSVIAEVTAEKESQVDVEFVLPLLIDMLGHLREQGGSGASDNAAVFAALGKLGPLATPAVPALVTVLERRPSQALVVRGLASEALGRIGPAAAPAVPAMIEHLEAALKAGNRRAQRGLPPDGFSNPRLSGAEIKQFVVALGGIGRAAADAVPVLKDLLTVQEAMLSKPLDLRSYEGMQNRERPTPEQIKAAIKQIEG